MVRHRSRWQERMGDLLNSTRAPQKENVDNETTAKNQPPDLKKAIMIMNLQPPDLKKTIMTMK